MAKLTIEVSADDLEKALQSAYMKQRNKISLPGFRKGKVPRKMIEKMYGPEIFYDDAANEIIPGAYAKAYDECELDIVSRPVVDIEQIERGKPFIFTAEVALKPEVSLGEYKGLEVDKVAVEGTAEEVEQKLKEEAEKNARTAGRNCTAPAAVRQMRIMLRAAFRAYMSMAANCSESAWNVPSC